MGMIQRTKWHYESVEQYEAYLSAIAQHDSKSFEDFFVTATVNVEGAKALRPGNSLQDLDADWGTTFQALYLKPSKPWADKMVACARFDETYELMICYIAQKNLKFETG